jgi:hypothetical protein
MSRPVALAPLLVLTLLAFSTAAAQQATVSGRVVESGTRTGILGAAIELPGRVPALTGADGTFEITGVASGSYTLRVEALGYARASLDLVVSGDTALTIELDRAPIELDSLVVESRDVTVKGEVRDKVRDIGLLNAEVYTSTGFAKQTDGGGRFSIGDVPANVPLVILVEEFGYLPLTTTIVPENDTTIRFELVDDPVVTRMIEHEMTRIAERAGEKRYPFEPTIQRDELLRSRNGSLKGVIRRRYRRPIGCWVLDERRYPFEVLDNVLEGMRPDEVEHIDALWYGRGKSSLLIRIYTRDFVRRMIGRPDLLVPLDDIVDGANTENCR